MKLLIKEVQFVSSESCIFFAALQLCSLCSKNSTEIAVFLIGNIRLVRKLLQYFVVTLPETDLLTILYFELLPA